MINEVEGRCEKIPVSPPRECPHVSLYGDPGHVCVRPPQHNGDCYCECGYTWKALTPEEILPSEY